MYLCTLITAHADARQVAPDRRAAHSLWKPKGNWNILLARAMLRAQLSYSVDLHAV